MSKLFLFCFILIHFFVFEVSSGQEKIIAGVDNTYSIGNVKLIPIYDLMEKFREKQSLFLTEKE
ncbi:MAG: hypothetical protein KF816_03405 [Melioribacteraceae bacterium]|nr:hypothetical protein [Melioribacteraceae bacterium]